MANPLASPCLDQLFESARTSNVWTNRPLEDGLLRKLYDLVKFAPTSANCSPARFVFVQSDAAKNRLKPYMMPGNDDKVMTAPATVIVGYDMDFADKIPQLFPHNPGAKDWFADPDVAFETAFRNSSLQGGYLIMAARALGLDCGPMSGFDKAGVDADFFSGTAIKSNFICALGYGSEDGLFPRSPRLSFDEACDLL